jgi:hypothetical protein
MRSSRSALVFKFYDIQQNTEEWLQMRCGRLTSSNLGKVMANYGKPFGDPAKKYAVQIAIEQITGVPESSNFTNEHMERGHVQEPLARMAYEEEMFCTVKNGGFFGSEFIGCSLDGLVGNDGGIEIKSVIPSVHYSNVKRANVDPAYKWQCIGNMKFPRLDWLDFISYCDAYPTEKNLFIYRLHAKDYADEYAMIDLRVEEFKALVNLTRDNIIKSEYMILNN